MTVLAGQPKAGLMWMCRICVDGLVANGVEGKGYCRTCWEATQEYGPAPADFLASSVSVVCGNCDTKVPPGCGGVFRDDGQHCKLNHHA